MDMGKSADWNPALRSMKPVERKRPWWEDVVIVLAVLTLWPRILGWSGMFYQVLEGLALGVLVVILVRRIGRFQRKKHSAMRQGAGTNP